MIGTRMRDEQKLFLCMIKAFIVEVVYKDDNMYEAASASAHSIAQTARIVN